MKRKKRSYKEYKYKYKSKKIFNLHPNWMKNILLEKKQIAFITVVRFACKFYQIHKSAQNVIHHFARIVLKIVKIYVVILNALIDALLQVLYKGLKCKIDNSKTCWNKQHSNVVMMSGASFKAYILKHQNT